MPDNDTQSLFVTKEQITRAFEAWQTLWQQAGEPKEPTGPEAWAQCLWELLDGPE